MNKLLSVLLLNLTLIGTGIICAHAEAASKVPIAWAEPVRQHALEMIDEAFRADPQSRVLPSIRNRLEHAELFESKILYAHAEPFKQNISLHPVLKDAPLSIQSFVLLHETAHLLFLGECDAEVIAADIVKNSLKSGGLMMFGYLRECPQLKERVCGKPAFIDRDGPSLGLDGASEKDLRKELARLTDYGKNADIPIFFIDRAKDWVGGDSSCTVPVPGDFNESLGKTYEDYFKRQLRASVVEYFTVKRQSLVVKLRERLFPTH